MKRTETRTIRQFKDSEEVFTIKVTIDFTEATPENLAEWAFSNRWIAVQNSLRQNWSDETMRQYEQDGLSVKATSPTVKDPMAAIRKGLETGKYTKEQLREMLGL